MLALLVAMLFMLPAAPSPDAPIGFGSEVVAAHRLTGSDTIDAPGDAQGFGVLRVTIDRAGRVVDVVTQEPLRLGDAEREAAFAAARQWTFRPFTFRGAPVVASGQVGVRVRPRPHWRDPAAAWPIGDDADTTIELTRTACFGQCPDYRVTVSGRGAVTFRTGARAWDEVSALHRAWNANGVLIPGTYRRTIDPAAAQALIARFRQAHFFGLKSAYRAEVTDNPTQVLRVSAGGRTMTVEDYAGDYVDLPAVVTELERAVDEVAGTGRWVTGDAQTVPTLVAGGFDPRSAAAAPLALAALNRGSEVVVLDLLAAGLSLDTVVDGGAEKVPLGLALLTAALSDGKPRVARALVERGWFARLPGARRSSLFAQSGGGCDRVLAAAMIAAGADSTVHAPATDSMMGDSGGTALHAALRQYGPCEDVADRPALVRDLIALGVDPNARNADGETALFVDSEDTAPLDALLAAGADPQARDAKGLSAAFSSWCDACVLTLLDAGAPFDGKEDGKTLRQVAQERHMPATLEWLDAHRAP